MNQTQIALGNTPFRASLKEPVQCDLLSVNLFCSLGQFGRSEIILLWAAGVLVGTHGNN